MHKLILEKSKIRFLLLEGIHENARRLLFDNNFTNVECLGSSLAESELIEKVQGVHFLGIRSQTQVTNHVLKAANELISIGCFCIGTNQIDLTEAALKGVPVFNAPYSNTRSVAELVLAESILLLRDIPAKNTQMHAGIWKKNAANSHEMRGKVLGIIGYGRIGSQLSILAESMGMFVVYCDISPKLPLGNAKQLSSMAEVLAQSDVISLHVPKTAQTDGMMGAQEFSQMKRGSIFINAARGSCVDIDALDEYLTNGHIHGAAIDVFPQEPAKNGELFNSVLRKHENILLTPHIGGSTLEAQENIGLEVTKKLIQYFEEGNTYASVNFPEIVLPLLEGKHRLLHIHRNIPGVLSSINDIFSCLNVNIASQQLMTSSSIGYLVLDADEAYRATVFNELLDVPGTIKVRILN